MTVWMTVWITVWMTTFLPLIVLGQKYPLILGNLFCNLILDLLINFISTVPGYMASQLEADVKKESSRLWWCSREGQNYSLWFDPFNMVPFAYDCWEDNIKLSYDFKERRTKDAPGVQVREVGFDNISSLRFSSKLSYPFCKSIILQFFNNFYFCPKISANIQLID